MHFCILRILNIRWAPPTTPQTRTTLWHNFSNKLVTWTIASFSPLTPTLTPIPTQMGPTCQTSFQPSALLPQPSFGLSALCGIAPGRPRHQNGARTTVAPSMPAWQWMSALLAWHLSLGQEALTWRMAHFLLHSMRRFRGRMLVSLFVKGLLLPSHLGMHLVS